MQVWNATTAMPVVVYRKHAPWVYAAAWAPDGSQLASLGRDKTIHVWNATTGTITITLPATFTYIEVATSALRWSSDGRYILFARLDFKLLPTGSTTNLAWDAATGPHLFSHREQADAVKAIAISPDARRILSLSAEAVIQIRETLTGKSVLSFNSNYYTSYPAITWSADGQQLVLTGPDTQVLISYMRQQVKRYLPMLCMGAE